MQWQEPADVVATVVGGEAAILDLRQGSMVSRNDTGTLIWEAALEGLEEPAIAARFSEAFAVPVAEALQDAITLLAELASAGLLEIARRKMAARCQTLTPRGPRSAATAPE